MPGVVITADQSDATADFMMKRFTAQQGFERRRIPGSHLFPLEQTRLTASLISEYAHSIADSNP
jgi:surfactin synthase thioesterase subunit